MTTTNSSLIFVQIYKIWGWNSPIFLEIYGQNRNFEQASNFLHNQLYPQQHTLPTPMSPVNQALNHLINQHADKDFKTRPSSAALKQLQKEPYQLHNIIFMHTMYTKN